MDIGSAFTFAFDDQDWIKKLAIGGVILLFAVPLSIVLVGLALFLPVFGYMLEVIKNVRDGQPTPLPEWDDFGSLFSKGLMVFVIVLAYNIPAILVACASAGVNLGVDQVDSDVAGSLAFAVICLNCVQVILSIGASLLFPAGIIRYARQDTLAAAFQFREIFKLIRENIGDYVIAVLLSWVAGLVAGLGIIICGIGIFFTYFWSLLVSANLYGQFARKAGA